MKLVFLKKLHSIYMTKKNIFYVLDFSKKIIVV